MEKLSLLSPAKVNLGLKVIAKRADGYHDIQSVFQMVGLCDTLTFEKIPDGIEVVTDHASLAKDRNNLVVRAAHLLALRVGKVSGARITLEKRIPLAAGLGGGSSNAAVTLLGLNRLWQLGMSQEELSDLARELGSDAPFFLFAPRAYGTGRGERLEALPPGGKAALILLHPALAISTAWAYASLEPYLGRDSRGIDILRHLIDAGRDEEIGPHLYNTFEGPIGSVYPVIGRLKEQLLRVGACGALMSGSGPTVFGLFRSRAEAEEANREIQARGLEGSSGIAFLADTVIDLDEVYGADPWKKA